MVQRFSRRSMVAALGSLVLHGGAVALVIAFALPEPHRVVQRSATELVAIESIAAPPAPTLAPVRGPIGPGAQPAVRPSLNAGAVGRRGHDLPKRSMTRAPRVPDPYADLAISYDTPTGPDPGSPMGTTGPGFGESLAGIGGGGGGGLHPPPLLASVPPPPPPPPPSLARPPRPKYSYSETEIRGSHKFAGKVIRLVLAIDERGVVRVTRIVQGVDLRLDERARELAERFEFEPALDQAGHPTAGTYPWYFVIPFAPYDPLDHAPSDPASRWR